MSFPHPPAQFVEDLSVQAGLYTAPSSAESLNWFGSQQNLLDLQNPPILSPVSQNPSVSLPIYQDPPILSPVHQDAQPPSMVQQNFPSPHPFSPNAFSGLQRFCANFSFPIHTSDTSTPHLFNLASAAIFPGGDVHSQL